MTHFDRLEDPYTTPVSFPKSATVHPHLEHDGVRFAKAFLDDVPPTEPLAYFVWDDDLQIPRWHRIAEADYKALVARIEADPECSLSVEAPRDSRTIVFEFGHFDKKYVQPDHVERTRIEVRSRWYAHADHSPGFSRRSA